MKKYTIYQITNTINGKIYIGKHETYNLEDGYMGSGNLLKSAQAKYGIGNFTKEILHVFETESEMNDKEAELVTENFCLREDTYNLCVGGQGGFSYINRNDLNVPIHKQNLDLQEVCRLAALKRKELASDASWNEARSKSLSLGIKKAYSEGRGFNKINPMHMPGVKEKHKESCKNNSKGSKNSQYGTMWINNGIESKKIKSIDAIPDGWIKGRVIKDRRVGQPDNR